MLTRFKNYLQSLSSSEQVYAINDMIDFIIATNGTTIDIKTKIRMIKELKDIRDILLFNL